MKDTVFEYGNGAISEKDWRGIEAVIKSNEIKTVIEFGCGTSTKNMDELCTVTSLETDEQYRDFVSEYGYNVLHWNNKELPKEITGQFDMAFVDGMQPRDWQIAHAKKHSYLIVVHDAFRPYEAALIKKELSGWLEIPIDGRSRAFKKQKSRFAVFVAATDNYLPYLNAQLNSLDYCNHTHDVHVISHGISKEYQQKANETFSFKIFWHENEFKGTPIKAHKAKFGRYADILKYGIDYDAVCMLDADMMVVKNFERYFELVAGTDLIIGCNEKFKWSLGLYEYDGKPITKEPIPMDWMICNAPLFLVPSKQIEFLTACTNDLPKLTCNGKQITDLFGMNIVLYLTNNTNKIIALPNYAWTGVHNGYYLWHTQAHQRGDGWMSETGEPVYILHGRFDGGKNYTGYYIRELKKRLNEAGIPEEKQAKHITGLESVVKQFRKRWDMMNYEWKLQLDKK